MKRNRSKPNRILREIRLIWLSRWILYFRKQKDYKVQILLKLISNKNSINLVWT